MTKIKEELKHIPLHTTTQCHNKLGFFFKISPCIGKIISKEFRIHTKKLATLSLNIQINKTSQIPFSNHKTLFTFQKNSIIYDAIGTYQSV